MIGARGAARLAGMLLTLAFAVSTFAAAPAALPQATTPAKSVTVPMLEVGGRPMIEVTINGKGPYALIFDTGASFTGIDGDLLDEVAPGKSELDELRIGGAAFRHFAVHRMPALPASLAGTVTPRGVLSASAFPGSLVVYDFPARRVTITPGSLPAADGKRVFEYPAGEELPLVPVRVAGHEYWIHLDTGSPSGVTLPTRTATDVPLEAPPVEIGRARTMGGTFPVSRATVNGTIEIGAFPLTLTTVEFSDVRPGPEPAPGNVGVRVLGGFIVTFDSAHRRVQLDRPER
jgi:hypothetical protein